MRGLAESFEIAGQNREVVTSFEEMLRTGCAEGDEGEL